MGKAIACTVITKNYLAYARTLGRSLHQHNPESTLYVLLADRLDGCFDPQQEPFQWIFLKDLSDPDWIRRMSFYYTPFEFCNALRGYLHEYLFNQTSHEQWMYLDADIWVLDSLEPIVTQLKEASVLLSPHRTEPAIPTDARLLELPVLQAGLYNSGFLGIRRSEESHRFIRWFKDRLKLHAFQEAALRQYADQSWLNFVPLYFKEVSFLTHPGANVGHWNLFERSFARNGDGTVTVDGRPILFLHFSGWDLSAPEQVSRHTQVETGRTPPFWEECALTYRERLLAQGYQETIRYPYAFDRFLDGRPITPRMRRMYYEGLLCGDYEGNPFAGSVYFARRIRTEQMRRLMGLPGRISTDLLGALHPFRA